MIKKQELVPGFPGRLRFFLIFCGGRREFKETVASSDKEVELDIVVANIFLEKTPRDKNNTKNQNLMNQFGLFFCFFLGFERKKEISLSLVLVVDIKIKTLFQKWREGEILIQEKPKVSEREITLN